jgi:hypothetical protein
LRVLEDLEKHLPELEERRLKDMIAEDCADSRLIAIASPFFFVPNRSCA